MCRFIAYLGKPLPINDVISRPRDSLIRQSGNALESDIKVNGDGFGIGWYNFDTTEIPAVFVSILPAWNDINLARISHQIVSPCFFGHVRAAEMGGVSLYNCHPFRHRNLLFMHNGNIGDFNKIRLDIFNLLDDMYFRNILGHTDSEVMFALWLTYYAKIKNGVSGMVEAWEQTLETIINLQRKHGVTERNYINAVVTNGREMAAVRYATDPKEILSLHYTWGEEFVHQDGEYFMTPSKPGDTPKCILLASEQLNNHPNDWHSVPPQSILAINSERGIQMLPLSALQALL